MYTLFQPQTAGLAIGLLEGVSGQRCRIIVGESTLPDSGDRMEILVRGAISSVAWVSRIAARCAVLFPKSPEESALQPSKVGYYGPTAPAVDNVVFDVVLSQSGAV